MLFKLGSDTELQDEITPPQIEIVKVETPAERVEWLAERTRELKEKMGPRYLCHSKNQVRRLDGRSYRPQNNSDSSNAPSLKRAA